jgi:hypothetical protein
LPGKIGPDPLVILKFFPSLIIADPNYSPRNDSGEPVLPSKLIAHIEEYGWETSPNCLCVIRGQNHVAVLYIPRTASSPTFGKVSLVCPESECPYFGSLTSRKFTNYLPAVNVQEMYEHLECRRDLLSVEDNSNNLPHQ